MSGSLIIQSDYNYIVMLHFVIVVYRDLPERLVSMVSSYWRSSAELEDLFSTYTRVT